MRIYPGTTVDYGFATLGGLGYTGTLNDRQFAAFGAEGLTGSLPDMFGQFDGTLGGGVSGFIVNVPSGKVTADLTNFTAPIDLSLIDATRKAEFWAAVRSDGGNIRAYAADGVTQIPMDLTYIHKTRQLGRLVVKTNLLTASDNSIVLKVLDAATTGLAVTDPYGRNAVWAGYEVVIMYPETVNRTGDVYTRAANEVPFSEWKRVDYYGMTGNPHQGVAVDTSGNLVTIDTNYLRRSTVAAPNTVLASNADPVGAIKTATGNTNLNHLGDGCIIAGELWVPCDEYPVVSGYDEYLCVFNLTTLALDRFYNVSSVERYISSICQDPDTGIIWATDYTNGASLMQFSTSGAYLGTVALSASIVDLQGIAFVEGSIFLSADDTDLTKVSKTGVIDVGIGAEFKNPQTGISEGISYANGKLYHMDGDGDLTVLQKVDSLADWGRLHYDRHYETYPRSTTWSMGVSVHWLETTGDLQQAFLTLANGSSNTQYATVTYDDGPDLVGLWNSTDGWIYSDLNAAYKGDFRIGAQHDGTTQRKLFLDGILKATDNTISARPSGSGSNMDFVINAADTSGNDDGEAYYQFAWARNDYVSEAWMAADAAFMNDPASMYTIT